MFPSGCRCLQSGLDIPHVFCLKLVAWGHFKFLPDRGYTKNQEIIWTQTCMSPGMLMVPDIPLRRAMGDLTRTLMFPWVPCWNQCFWDFTPALPTGLLPSLSALWVVEIQGFYALDFDCRWNTGRNPMSKKAWQLKHMFQWRFLWAFKLY